MNKPLQINSLQAGGGRALDRDALEQAISNTCIRDGFTVKRCNTPKECVEFLAEMTEAITGTKTLRILSPPSYSNPSIIN